MMSVQPAVLGSARRSRHASIPPLRHHHVEQNAIGLEREGDLHPCSAVGRFGHLEPAGTEAQGFELAHLGSVVDDEDPNGPVGVMTTGRDSDRLTTSPAGGGFGAKDLVHGLAVRRASEVVALGDVTSERARARA